MHNALLVQPNSGCGEGNRCLLDAIAGSEGRFKEIALVPLDISGADMTRLKAQGIVGVAFNLPFHSVP